MATVTGSVPIQTSPFHTETGFGSVDRALSADAASNSAFGKGISSENTEIRVNRRWDKIKPLKALWKKKK